ncbi:RluA family pseudouridine synthase [Evansella sp. LMS18]|jgi:23S rRNA pseudouridine1911/1915/1917 synthase|uniref:RluA family pseudouridine synthase n=1 Tax=Evansella sp. LMS18 TaxID=2924033 RepID=UPI0020D11092|nr:RluA family pseudouridine synthase [Evansella sp. LMS18]UTR11108.1 RluA family pseudouridine synthase [Evansella sp. LMS18]
MNGIILQWKAGAEEDGQLLKTFLRVKKGISKKALADIKFKGGDISVDGRRVTVRHVLKEGEAIKITFPPENVSEGIVSVERELDIVFEDDHLLVINKPPSLSTIPSREHREVSLAGAVVHYYKKHNIPSTFHAVNRLDKDTSGLMLVAKHRYVHDLFVRMQMQHNIERTYTALLEGKLSKGEGTIDLPIGRKSTSIIEREVTPDGQEAVTHFKAERLFSEASLVSINLETGRTHQIRVHFSHLGHPLAGDTLYGGTKKLIGRQALHSSKIKFLHPIENKILEFTSPLFSDMENAIKTLEAVK